MHAWFPPAGKQCQAVKECETLLYWTRHTHPKERSFEKAWGGIAVYDTHLDCWRKAYANRRERETSTSGWTIIKWTVSIPLFTSGNVCNTVLCICINFIWKSVKGWCVCVGGDVPLILCNYRQPFLHCLYFPLSSILLPPLLLPTITLPGTVGER